MGNSSSAEADDNDWGYPRFQRNDRGRAMADEAPLTLRNRAAHPERGYQPEPSIDAALGGAFNTSGRSNLLAEEVNEVTDTEDEDQELMPPGASANDREEQPEAPNVQSQGQTLGEHDHEVETLRRKVAAAAGDQAAYIFGAIFVGFVYTFILQIPRVLALVVWGIIVAVGVFWLAHLIGKVENENEDDGHRIQYSIVRRFPLVLSETVYKQKVYETEEAAKKAWKKEDGCYSSVMFKLCVDRFGLLPTALHKVKTKFVGSFFSNAKKPLPEDIRASTLEEKS